MELLVVTRITQVEAEAREYQLIWHPPSIPCCQDVASNRAWYWHDMDDEKQISTVAKLKMYLFFFCTFICSYLEFTPAYCIYVKKWLKQSVMVLKRGSWETRPKHWSSISNCICFVFVFASNTLQAKVRLSIAWLNVSVLVKKLFRSNSNKCQCSDENARALLTNDYSTSVLYSTTCFSSAAVSQDVWHLTPPPRPVSLEHRASFENYNFRSQPRCKTAPLGLYLAANSTLVTRAPYFGSDASSTALPHLCLLQSTKRHPHHFWWVWLVAWTRDLFIVCKPSICLELSVKCLIFYFPSEQVKHNCGLIEFLSALERESNNISI